MRRGMTGPQTQELLRHIRKDFPELTLRTTVLVGFPGETEQDFQELLDFITEFQFDRLGAFAFSPEANTPAAEMKDGLVSPKIAEERKQLILEAQRKISLKHNKAFIGKDIRVLLEQRETDRGWLARSTADAPDVDDVIHVSVKNKRSNAPRFTNVHITNATEYECEGKEI
jgi:ribosomal protein S12 methylthiotransferase